MRRATGLIGEPGTNWPYLKTARLAVFATSEDRIGNLGRRRRMRWVLFTVEVSTKDI